MKQTMYAIASGDVDRLQVHVRLSRSDLATRSGQKDLQRMESNGHQLRCLCKGVPSSPMFLRQNSEGMLYPVRTSATEHEHLLTCTHGASDKSQAFGAPPGSIQTEDGQVTVDFDKLFVDHESMSDGEGEWQGAQQDQGAALRSMLWLLVHQAGLDCAWPNSIAAHSWGTLLWGAESINVRARRTARPLARMLVTQAQATQPKEGKKNYAKLCDAREGTRRLLVACWLPKFERDKWGLDIICTEDALDIRVSTSPKVLARALGQAPFAWKRHESGQPVLAFGLASLPKSKEKRCARMTQLILMPASPHLMPLPTGATVDGYERSMKESKMFSVSPNDDPLITMRARKVS